jgi:hypothetical protein
MWKLIGKGLVALVIIGGWLFSAYQNFALFRMVLGTDQVGTLFSVVGLVLFDIGAVAWALYFSHGARGAAQRATALTASLACLTLMLTAASLHLWLDQSLTEVPPWAGMAAMVAITVALCVNGVSAYLVHVADPGTLKEIRMRAVEDSILEESYRQLEAKGKQIAGAVAEQVSDEMRDDAVRALLGATMGGRNSVPQLAAAGAARAYRYNADAEREPELVADVEPVTPSANGTRTRARKEAPPKGQAR